MWFGIWPMEQAWISASTVLVTRTSSTPPWIAQTRYLKSARGLVEIITIAQLSSKVGWFEKWHQRNSKSGGLQINIKGIQVRRSYMLCKLMSKEFESGSLAVNRFNLRQDWFWYGCILQAGGVAVILGLVKATERVSFHPGKLLWGKSWKSGLFGGYKGVTQLPELVDKCVEGVSLAKLPTLLEHLSFNSRLR